MNAMQLNFFEEIGQENEDDARIKLCEERLGNLRRGVFARMGDMSLALVEHDDQIYRLSNLLADVLTRIEALEKCCAKGD